MLSLHWCALSIVLLYNNATCTMKDTLMFLAIFVQVCGCMACNCYPRWLPSLLLWVAVHCALFVLCVVSYCKYLHLNVCCVRAECRLSIWCKHAAFCCCFAFLLHISVYYCTVCKVGLPAECVLLFRAAVSCCICVGHCTVVKCVPCNRLYLAYGHCWVWCTNWHAICI